MLIDINNYNQEDNMGNVSIISVKDYSSLLGKLIGFFLGKYNGERKYNHTAILIGNYVYEKNMSKGYNLIHLDVYKKDKEVFIHRNIFPVNHITMIDDMDNMSNIRYDWLYSLSFLFRKFFVIKTSNRLNCVQWVEVLFNKQKYSVLENQYFDPHSLFLFLNS